MRSKQTGARASSNFWGLLPALHGSRKTTSRAFPPLIFFQTSFFIHFRIFSLYLERRSDEVQLIKQKRVGGGLQLRKQLCIRGKKLVSYTDRIMKRVFRSIPHYYLHPSPLAGCLVAWCAGERGQRSKQMRAFHPLNFFQTSFFLHFHPFFLFI